MDGGKEVLQKEGHEDGVHALRAGQRGASEAGEGGRTEGYAEDVCTLCGVFADCLLKEIWRIFFGPYADIGQKLCFFQAFGFFSVI